MALPPSPRLILVTGPARSGKSEWAESLAMASGVPVTYVATALIDPSDRDWRRRIDQHRDRRPATWDLLEIPHALPEAIAEAPGDRCLLVDSLGTWLTNHLDLDDGAWRDRHQALLDACTHSAATIICVAEETGWGVVPAYPIGRLFRDRLGHLTRAIALQADDAHLVCAGYALNLKHLGHPITPHDTPDP
ncbi:MAG: bifunctional adenosylcobinamide kinase/adenosylcobinamide-phosphate guanylyltransferase [Cyanophyceae cyanobacterium]